MEASVSPSRRSSLGAAIPTHVRLDERTKGLSLLDSRPDDIRHTDRYESINRPFREQHAFSETDGSKG